MSDILNDCDALLQAAVTRFIPPPDRAVLLSASSRLFKKPVSGPAAPASIVLTARLLNMDGVVTFSTSPATTMSVSGNVATLDFADMGTDPVTVTATFQKDGITYDAKETIAVVQDGTNGTNGTNAKLLVLVAASQVFQINKAGANTPSSIALNATAQNLAGAPTFTVVAGTATLTDGANAYEKFIAFGNMTSDSVTVQVAQDGLIDKVTIVKLREGADGTNGTNGTDAITGLLTNEAVTLSADAAGTVSSFTPANGTFKVFQGTVDKTGTTGPVTYTVFSQTGCTVAITTAGAYSVSAMSADTATAVLRAVYGGVTIDKTLSLAKSKTGAAGTPAKYVRVSFTGQTFSRADSTQAYAPASITLTANPVGGSATYAWSYWNGSAWTAIAGATAATYNVASGDFADARTYRVTATIGGTACTDDVTIAHLTGGKDGTNGTNGTDPITGFLTNESATLAATSAGVVNDFTPPSGNFKVYQGTVDKTANATYTVASQTGCTVAITTAGAYSVSAMTADTASAVLQAVYGGVTIQKSLTLSKAKAGNDGVFAAELLWEFRNTADGWTGTGGTLATGADSISMTASTTDPVLISPAVNIVGSLFDKIRARVRRTAGSAWQGAVYYTTSGHGNSESYKDIVSPDPTVTGQWVIVEWDMASLTAGGTDWTTNTITQFRLDLGNSATDAFEIDWIAVGKYAPINNHTWIKYATSPAGDNMSDNSLGKTYIGIAANKSTAIESTNAADYVWALIGGPSNPNLAFDLKWWGLNAGVAFAVDNTNQFSTNGEELNFTAAGSGVADGPMFKLEQNVDYTVSFTAVSTIANTTLYSDLWPDTLPQSTFSIGTTAQQYKATWNSASADMLNCRLRLFNDATGGAITISDVKLEKGNKATSWNSNGKGPFSVDVGADIYSLGSYGTRTVVTGRPATVSPASTPVASYAWTVENQEVTMGTGTKSIYISGSTTSSTVTVKASMGTSGQLGTVVADIVCRVTHEDGRVTSDSFHVECEY